MIGYQNVLLIKLFFKKILFFYLLTLNNFALSDLKSNQKDSKSNNLPNKTELWPNFNLTSYDYLPKFNSSNWDFYKWNSLDWNLPNWKLYYWNSLNNTNKINSSNLNIIKLNTTKLNTLKIDDSNTFKNNNSSWNNLRLNSNWELSKINLLNWNLTNWMVPKWNYSNNYSKKNVVLSNSTNKANKKIENNRWELPKFNTTYFDFSSWKFFKNSSLSSKDFFDYMNAFHYGNLIFSDDKLVVPNKTEPLKNVTKDNKITVLGNGTLIETNKTTMSLGKFKERLLEVYDNFTSCIHPCQNVFSERSSFKRTINGCGPSYFSERQISYIPYGEFFKSCCDKHDLYYASCGFEKKKADYSFLECMLDLINKTKIEDTNSWLKIKTTFGYALFSIVEVFGCKAWSISQLEVCECNSS